MAYLCSQGITIVTSDLRARMPSSAEIFHDSDDSVRHELTLYRCRAGRAMFRNVFNIGTIHGRNGFLPPRVLLLRTRDPPRSLAPALSRLASTSPQAPGRSPRCPDTSATAEFKLRDKPTGPLTSNLSEGRSPLWRLQRQYCSLPHSIFGVHALAHEGALSIISRLEKLPSSTFSRINAL